VVALASRRWRSLLTMISILIGVAGVLVIDSVGHSQREALAAQLAQFGTNVVSIQPGAATVRGVSAGAGSVPSLRDRDVALIRARVENVAALAPEDAANFQPISVGHNVNATNVVAAPPEFQAIQGLSVARGTFFARRDEETGARVAVIGPTVVRHLFPDGGSRMPLGQRVRVRGVEFEIIGVLAARGHNGQTDLDNLVIVPFSTGERYLFGPNALAGILVQVDDPAHLPKVMAELKGTLERSHELPPGSSDDFRLTNFQQLIDAAQQQATLLTRILSYVAAIAMGMGGLGIMNIMLLSVTERTSEIGLLIAVGAGRRDVLLQFLAEAAALAIGGGVGGVALGFGVAAILSRLVAALTAYPELPSIGAVALSLAVSLAIGIAFGLYPAARAAWLDPIVALRAAE
jgi:putative ABC transport system permease protein